MQITRKIKDKGPYFYPSLQINPLETRTGSILVSPKVRPNKIS